jgi:hypothetical protein
MKPRIRIADPVNGANVFKELSAINFGTKVENRELLFVSPHPLLNTQS